MSEERLSKREIRRRKVVVGQICRTFRLEGLTIAKKAAQGIESQLRAEQDSRKQAALELIIRKLKERISRTTGTVAGLVSVSDVSAVIAELSKDDDDRARECLQIFNAFQMPRLKWNVSRKELFYRSAEEGNRLHGLAMDKIQMHRDRLQLIQQRLMRHPLFSPSSIGSSKREYVELTQIESVRGTPGPKCLLGALSQLEENRYYLEDLNGSILLDLSNCATHGGYFVESCIVLVEGILAADGEYFIVHNIGFPPPEPRRKTFESMSHLEHLGIVPSSQEERHLRVMEEEAEDGMFVVLSNVHLDEARVLEKIRILLEGFNVAPPTLFVFCGNFTSRPFGQGVDDRVDLTRYFDKFASVIAGYKNIVKKSRFLFVPGPNDAGGNGCLPRPPLPKVFTKRLRQVLPTATFGTNPCRLRYYTQEIVIFRENLLSKIRRNCVIAPNIEERENDQRQINRGTDQEKDNDGNLAEMEFCDEDNLESENDEVSKSSKRKTNTMSPVDQLLKTVCDQSHLCPVAPHVKPIHWAMDHSLWLYPLPDAIFFADYYDQYLNHYEDCRAINPGSFPTDFSFVVYRPAEKEVEFSRVP
eukprot:g1425.t1